MKIKITKWFSPEMPSVNLFSMNSSLSVTFKSSQFPSVDQQNSPEQE